MTNPKEGLALLCLDLQPVFLDVVAEGERLRRRAGLAIGAAAGLGIPVLFTEQVPHKLGATEPTLLSGAPGARVFPKETFSAMADEAVRAELKAREVEHVLLCGLETPVCVYQTALDLRASRREVTLLADAVSGRRPDDSVACLRALERAGVHVLPTETVFYALLHEARHPFFRTFTQLVKTQA